MAPDQPDYKHDDEQQGNSDDGPQCRVPGRIRTISRELMVTPDVGLFVRVNSQKGSPLSTTNCTRLYLCRWRFQFVIVGAMSGFSDFPKWKLRTVFQRE
jgi:hypothetical protein